MCAVSSFPKKTLPARPFSAIRKFAPASISWPEPDWPVFAAATTKPHEAMWRRAKSYWDTVAPVPLPQMMIGCFVPPWPR